MAACRPRRCLRPRSTPSRRVASTPFGLTLPRAEIDFAKVHAHVHGVIAAIAPNDFTGALHRPRRAGDRRRGALHRCRDRRGRRQVRDQGAALRDRDRLLARGPADPGTCRDAVISPTRRSSISRRCPEHLIIIGAGPIGLELAQAHRRLGAKVTVLEAARAARQGRSGMRARSCSTTWRAKASRSAPASRSTRVGHTEGKIQAVIESSQRRRNNRRITSSDRHRPPRQRRRP